MIDCQTVRAPGTPSQASRHAVRCALLAAVLCVPLSVQADEGGAHALAQVAADTVDAALRPAYATFATEATTLADSMRTRCAAGAGPDTATLTTDWRSAVSAFAGIEFLRIGPLLDDNRLNRLFYWPDKRRAGERQLRELLTEPLASITADSMAARSVAVEGFPALERLLFPNGEVAGSEARCTTAIAVSGHVSAIAAALDRAWQDDDGIARQVREPRADDELLRDHEEVLRRIGTQIDTGLDILIERKLAPVLEGEVARLRGLPFVRSGTLVDHLRGNVASLRALMLDNGLAAAAGLESELGFEFRIADGHLDRLAELLAPAPQAIGAAHGEVGEVGEVSSADDWPMTLDEEQAGVVRALHSVLSSIRNTLRERLLPTLGIRTGFNSEDGD